MWKPGDYEITVLIILYTKDCFNELLTRKKNLLQVCCIGTGSIIEKKVLAMVHVQSISLILLRVKSRALEYKCR